MHALKPQMGTRSRRTARARAAPGAGRGASQARRSGFRVCSPFRARPLGFPSLPAFPISKLVHNDFAAANVYSFRWAGALTPAFDYSWLSTRTRKDDHG